MRRFFVCVFGGFCVASQIIPAVVNYNYFTMMNATHLVLQESERGSKILDQTTLEHFAPDCSPILGVPWLFWRSVEVAPILHKGQFGQFSAKWEGEILIPEGEAITFRIPEGSEIRVKIDERKIVDSIDSSPPVRIGTLSECKPGWRPLRVKFRKKAGRGLCLLEWRCGPEEAFRPVPRESFRHGDDQPGLLAKHYLSPKWRNKWLEQVEPDIYWDWTEISPFDEWLARGFPSARMYHPPQYPQRRFAGYEFIFNAWPLHPIYSSSLLRSAPFLLVLATYVSIFVASLIWLCKITR